MWMFICFTSIINKYTNSLFTWTSASLYKINTPSRIKCFQKRRLKVVLLNRLLLLQCPLGVILDNSLNLTAQRELSNVTSPLN